MQWFVYNCRFCRRSGRAFECMKKSKAGYDCFNHECPKHFSKGKKKNEAVLFFDQRLSNDENELRYVVHKCIPNTARLLAKAKKVLKAKQEEAKGLSEAQAEHMLSKPMAKVAVFKDDLAAFVSRRDQLQKAMQ